MSRLIDADALLKDIADYPYGYRGMIKDTIAKQPTVEPVKHGRWIKVEDDYDNHLYECSCCHTWTSLPTEEVNDGTIRYCWNCGARMDG